MSPNNLSELRSTLERQDPKVLLALLSQYSERWHHNSTQIWSTGSIFVPLSLSGIALGFDDRYRTVAVALFSIVLIWIWYFISERLRRIIDRNWQVYATIETVLLKLDPPRLNYGLDELIPRQRQREFHLRRVRFFIPVVITIAWLFAVILSFLMT